MHLLIETWRLFVSEILIEVTGALIQEGLTPIRRFLGLPSPNENVRVSIAYFYDGDNEPERIAFIWEITSNREKITDIRVVYDGSNPFIDELKAINEYEAKNRTIVLAPSKFPFDITHIDADVDKETLMLI